MNPFTIDTPTRRDLDRVVQLVALAQHQPASAVNRGLYEQLCAGGGSIALPGLPVTSTGRVARDGHGTAIGVVYAAFPLHHLVPVPGAATEKGALLDLMRAVTEVNVLAVAPAQQGRGIGTALVDDALDRARQSGAQAALVTAPDAAAAGFWAARGFDIGQCALRLGGGFKMPLRPEFHAQGLRALTDDCQVTRRGRVIAARWAQP